MLNRLKGIKTRYDEISGQIADPEVIAKQDVWRELMREQSAIAEIVEKYESLLHNLKAQEEARELLNDNDGELRDMANAELRELQAGEQALIEALRILMLPKDPNDERNVLIEIRAGTGGEEAALFGADLMRMYTRYAERHHYGMEMLSSSITDMGGVKEAIFMLTGKGAYSKLKFESGAHRVQRVPETESGGRIHTSAATVAVLPEAEDVEVEINPNDLRVDVFRSGGHGGQSVNTTDSAVRITHLPSGLVVTCQDEKSQLKNKEKALKVLKSRLLDFMQSQQQSETAQQRRAQVGSGDRSERVRTYNFPQNRVTDHRINMTLYKLDAFLDGDMDEMIDGLILAERAALLSGMGDGTA